MLTAKVRWSPLVGNNLSATPLEDVRPTVGYLEVSKVFVTCCDDAAADLGS